MDRPHDNAYWVIPDRLLAAEYPGRADRPDELRRIEFLLKRGFDFFVDLTEPGEQSPYDHAVVHCATYQRAPIADMSVPSAPQQMIQILDALDDAIASERRIYLHRLGGVGRTGTVVGCHLVRHGMSGTEALAQIAAWWATTGKRHFYTKSPQTQEQVDFVLGWEQQDPRRAR